jgi:hypothetical protein
MGCEDIKHILFTCERAQAVWRCLGVWNHIQEVLSEDMSRSVAMEEIIRRNEIIQDLGVGFAEIGFLKQSCSFLPREHFTGTAEEQQAATSPRLFSSTYAPERPRRSRCLTLPYGPCCLRLSTTHGRKGSGSRHCAHIEIKNPHDSLLLRFYRLYCIYMLNGGP